MTNAFFKDDETPHLVYLIEGDDAALVAFFQVWLLFGLPRRADHPA